MTHLSSLKNVYGRFQSFISKGGIIAIIDYAHTPDALENGFNMIQKIRTRNEKIIIVVGCGDDRDRTKRHKIDRIDSQQSEIAIFTSDNPRSEDPELILEEMEAGVEPQNYKKTLKITDRKDAIKTALKM